MFYVFPTPQEIADYVSAQMFYRLQAQTQLVLGLATGSTMKPVYARLIKQLQENPVDLSKVYCFNLDEYVGLAADHPQSYAAYMQEHLFEHVLFFSVRVCFLPGLCHSQS